MSAETEDLSSEKWRQKSAQQWQEEILFVKSGHKGLVNCGPEVLGASHIAYTFYLSIVCLYAQHLYAAKYISEIFVFCLRTVLKNGISVNTI